MTNPTRKRVVTLDDLNVLNQNAAYARQKGEEASVAAHQANTARQTLEPLGEATRAAGEYATQAAQAATLAKNNATAAAVQASQAAGEAVVAAELAEGAAGSANQAAGAATTAAQRVTDAVLDLTDIKDDIAQQTADTLAQFEAQATAKIGEVDAAIAATQNGARIANAVATITPTLTSTSTGSESALTYSTGSIITAWGFPVGTRTNFNRVSFNIQPHAAPITRVRVRVKNGGYEGTVVADVILNVTTTVGVKSLITAEFSLVATADWVEWFCDQPTGFFKLVDGTLPGSLRFANGGSTTDTTLGPGQASIGSITFTFADYSASTVTPRPTWTDLINAELGYERDAVATLGTVEDQLTTLTGESLNSTKALNTLATSGSQFYGFGFPVGAKQNFNYIEFNVLQVSDSKPVTRLRVRLRQTNGSGTILAEKLLTVRGVTGARTLARWKLGSTIANASATPLWLEVFADGWIGYAGVYTGTGTAEYVPPTYPAARFVAGSTPSVDAALAVDFSPPGNIWARFGLSSTRALALNNSFVRGITDTINPVQPWTPTSILPSTLYAVEGQELSVYWDSVLNLPGELAEYDIAFYTGTGKGLLHNRRWAWTPTAADAGTTVGATLFVKRFGVTVLEAATSIQVTGLSTAASTRKTLVIGDSITNRGVWMSEVIRLTQRGTDPLDLTSIGTRAGTEVPVGNPAVSTEGWEGKTIAFHYADPLSNFTFNGTDPAGTVFSFSQYLTANGFSMSAGDLVAVHLGTNDLGPAATVADANTKISEMVTQVEAMIANICAAVPGINVGVIVPIQPGTRRPRTALHTYQRLWQQRILRTFGGRTAQNIYVIPMAHALDTDYGYPYVIEPVSARSAALTTPMTQVRLTDWIHPNVSGYFQMADAFYAFVKWLWR
ncbi:hypothetical protein GCM10008959_34380 [Deinococcus seoulensis]|uniref:SGNH hydrolase-type esterase domain-containing protein n=1 Tax=Deinococcus seoulensis TaxID=1837379 RepID=A0ABQ2RVE7_9DEIO|nr:SGNH/GDSL hydrolase family protein [Deinococcus seoulensis]GGR69601.1 hypothetical protein GCM10008959_34380 [Deinococcus seoulensis]